MRSYSGSMISHFLVTRLSVWLCAGTFNVHVQRFQIEWPQIPVEIAPSSGRGCAIRSVQMINQRIESGYTWIK